MYSKMTSRHVIWGVSPNLDGFSEVFQEVGSQLVKLKHFLFRIFVWRSPNLRDSHERIIRLEPVYSPIRWAPYQFVISGVIAPL